LHQVAVFIDWQNTYKAARRAFGLATFGDAAWPNEYGNFSPYRLARLLAAANGRGDTGALVRVEIHRGLPASSRDPVGYAANRRQAQAWIAENPEVVMPRLRPLRYRDDDDGSPEEKGVDVNLALGAVEQIVLHKCETAIIFSHDTDLLPAVEALVRIGGVGCVETASWVSDSHRSRLRSKARIFHHFLDEAIFRSVETRINYARAR
jgi:uncharacterized LabA/DUF88 family protein